MNAPTENRSDPEPSRQGRREGQLPDVAKAAFGNLALSARPYGSWKTSPVRVLTAVLFSDGSSRVQPLGRPMCGRTSLFAPPAELRDRFDAAVPDAYRPRYNVAPTDPIEVVTADEQDVIQRFHWGLKPSWADADDDGFVNARSETVAETSAFADAWESRPCLVLSSGFYEWKETGRGRKQPYRVHRVDDPAFAMAGLYERWEGGGEPLDTVTVLTTGPNDLVEPLHHRMAVILRREDERTWLTAGPGERARLCRPYSGGDLAAYPVSTAINDPTNDSPELIEPAESEQTGLGDFAE